MKKLGLCHEWAALPPKYQLIEVLSHEYFTVTVRGVDKSTGKPVLIRQVKKVFNTDYYARRVLREITLLRQLSAIDGNVFTAKLLEVIIPGVDLLAWREKDHGFDTQ